VFGSSCASVCVPSADPKNKHYEGEEITDELPDYHIPPIYEPHKVLPERLKNILEKAGKTPIFDRETKRASKENWRSKNKPKLTGRKEHFARASRKNIVCKFGKDCFLYKEGNCEYLHLEYVIKEEFPDLANKNIEHLIPQGASAPPTPPVDKKPTPTLPSTPPNDNAIPKFEAPLPDADIAEREAIHNGNMQSIFPQLDILGEKSLCCDVVLPGAKLANDESISEQILAELAAERAQKIASDKYLTDMWMTLRTFNFERWSEVNHDCCWSPFTTKKKMCHTLTVVHVFEQSGGKEDLRPDYMLNGGLHRHLNPVYITLRYRKQIYEKTFFYSLIKNLADVPKWTELLYKGASYIDEEIIISYELLRQIKTANVVNVTMDHTTMWNRIVNAAKNTTSINTPKDDFVLSPITTNTCVAALEIMKFEDYATDYLDFPRAPVQTESMHTGPELTRDSNYHKLAKCKKTLKASKQGFMSVMNAAHLLCQSAYTYTEQRLSGSTQTIYQQLLQVREKDLLLSLQNTNPEYWLDSAFLSSVGSPNTSLLFLSLPTIHWTPGLIIADTLLFARCKLKEQLKKSPLLTRTCITVSFTLLSLLLSQSLIVTSSILVASTLAMISLKVWLDLFST
jgi:hypothetical protein